MKNVIAILGIHTGIGKTVASAVLAESLRADYWKPVQAGDLQNSDSIKVSRLITNRESVVHPEAVRLNHPLSPHEAARLDNVAIDYKSMLWPTTSRLLFVETAGGILSPMNDGATMIDFVSYYNLPAVLVVRHYLGSINHTLMSLEVLKGRKINVLGLIISGSANKASESFIASYSPEPVLACISEFPVIDAASISKEAEHHRPALKTLLKYAHA